MEAEFSKKMCQRLEAYEDYIENECKSPLLQKDKVLVDRNELMALIRELKVFHSADQHLEDEGFELDPASLQMTKEQLLKNAMWQARQMVTEAEVVRTSTLEDAVSDAKKEAERIMIEAKAYDAKVKAEAEDIVAMTLSERRQALEDARKDLENNREGILENTRKQSEQILADAKKQREQILADTREEAEQLRKRLDEEIEAYRKEREAEMKASLEETQRGVMALMEEETDKALDIYSDAVYKAEEMANLMAGMYEQQLEVIQRDRQDILDIISKLERRGVQK